VRRSRRLIKNQNWNILYKIFLNIIQSVPFKSWLEFNK
jgi:hypothetical protein